MNNFTLNVLFLIMIVLMIKSCTQPKVVTIQYERTESNAQSDAEEFSAAFDKMLEQGYIEF